MHTLKSVPDRRAYLQDLLARLIPNQPGLVDASTVTAQDWLVIAEALKHFADAHEHAVKHYAERLLEQLRRPLASQFDLRELQAALAGIRATLEHSPSVTGTADAQVVAAVASFPRRMLPVFLDGIRTLAGLDAAIEQRLAQEAA